LGRSRRLLGTKPILVRLSEELAQALSDWAEQEGVSRNTLVGRELATMVMERKKQSGNARALDHRTIDQKPSELKEGRT
jgi:hypothetical protein